jgi:vacuolar-type H+-ATPase subunit F/Vma7
VRIFALAGPEDVRGFALAGVEGSACAVPGQARAMLRELLRDREANGIGLLLLSGAAAREACGEVRELRRSGAPPLVVILPDERGPAA